MLVFFSLKLKKKCFAIWVWACVFNWTIQYWYSFGISLGNRISPHMKCSHVIQSFVGRTSLLFFAQIKTCVFVVRICVMLVEHQTNDTIHWSINCNTQKTEYHLQTFGAQNETFHIIWLLICVKSRRSINDLINIWTPFQCFFLFKWANQSWAQNDLMKFSGIMTSILKNPINI